MDWNKYFFCPPTSNMYGQWTLYWFWWCLLFHAISTPKVSLSLSFIWFLRSGSQIGKKGTIMLPARIWIETLIFSVHPAQICMVNGFYIYFEDFYFFATISAPTVSIFSLFIWLLRCWSQIGKKGTIMLPSHIWFEKIIFMPTHLQYVLFNF